MTGIYKIVNDLNNKVYIGQSVNIQARWRAHLSSSLGGKMDSNSKLHTAMRELGPEHFSLEIVEECTPEELNTREVFWIAQYQAKENGYNSTKGGTGVQGENNPRAKLTEEDVLVIRTLYNNKVPFREVLKLYEGIISKRGLQKVWRHETWLNIMPEVYTEENKHYHATMAKGFSQKRIVANIDRMPKPEQIAKMKQLRNEEHLSYEKIGKIVGFSTSVVRKYCLNLNSPEPQKIGFSVKNIETSKIFPSYKEAAKWAGCERHTISRFLEGRSRYGYAGHVPETGEPATWTTNI